MLKFLRAKEWLCHFKLSRLLPLLNLVFWLVFSVILVIQSFPYRPHKHKPAFEEISYSYIFFGRALREIDSGTGVALPPTLMKVTYAVQRPSVVAARPFYLYTNGRGLVVDNLFFGISVGGHHLLVVCLLSFAQWSLVGLLFDAIVLHIKNSDQANQERAD
jgi:hypothetical protein